MSKVSLTATSVQKMLELMIIIIIIIIIIISLIRTNAAQTIKYMIKHTKNDSKRHNTD